mgnify:FL=1
MKIHFQINNSNEKHTRFTVFVDSISCGELCMLSDDFLAFYTVLRQGTSSNLGHMIELSNHLGKSEATTSPREIWNPPL